MYRGGHTYLEETDPQHCTNKGYLVGLHCKDDACKKRYVCHFTGDGTGEWRVGTRTPVFACINNWHGCTHTLCGDCFRRKMIEQDILVRRLEAEAYNNGARSKRARLARTTPKDDDAWTTTPMVRDETSKKNDGAPVGDNKPVEKACPPDHVTFKTLGDQTRFTPLYALRIGDKEIDLERHDLTCVSDLESAAG
jgi:hypothetical protein